jgi:hypothetical protein
MRGWLRRFCVTVLLTALSVLSFTVTPAYAHQLTDGPDACTSGGWAMNRWVSWGHYQNIGPTYGQVMLVQMESLGGPFDWRVWIGDSYRRKVFDRYGHSSSTRDWVFDGAEEYWVDSSGPYSPVVYVAMKRGGYSYCNIVGSAGWAYLHW